MWTKEQRRAYHRAYALAHPRVSKKIKPLEPITDGIPRNPDGSLWIPEHLRPGYKPGLPLPEEDRDD